MEYEQDHIYRQPEPTGTAPLLRPDHLSNGAAATKSRNRRMLDETGADQAHSRKYRHKQAVKRVVLKATKTHNFLRGLEARVAHHLSKGRDLSDIVVREGAMASQVSRIIEGIRGRAAR